MSSITFGYYDYGHIEKGQNGLVGFDNVGDDNWSIMLKSIKYNDQPLQRKGTPKLAHIDSAGLLIQMPMTEFKTLTSYL